MKRTPLSSVRGLRPLAAWLDEAQNAVPPPTMVDVAALQRMLDERQQRKFDEYRQSLIDFMAYRQALLERL